MNVEITLKEATELHLTRAILLYENNSASMATVHQVATTEGVPTLLPGSCLTVEDIGALITRLSKANTSRQILPPEVLCDTNCLCWWKPAHRSPIFFNTTDKAFNKAMKGKEVLHPPLLFLATPTRLSVFALAENERPTAETPLYHAPYYNLYDGGNMCAGNVRLPEVTLVRDIPLWEKAFFETNFTHSNAGKRTKHPGGHNALWKNAVFWREEEVVLHFGHLLPLKTTLAKVVNHE